MVGKNKAQRSKNNARPSSSGRSAELLSTQLANLKDIGFLAPLMKNEEFDPSVKSDFQIVFKRMNKKDTTTKLKALQEFSDLVKNSEPDAIKLILNFWCRIYISLAIDIDHRIREAVQYAHYQIILKDKKMLAPVIKQIIGAWFTSQYDTYPPAATIAMKSFQTTFAAEKVQNCLLFCHKEILSFIKSNLMEFANYTGKFNDDDDDQAKLERMLLSSLQGYCMYLDVLTSEQIQIQHDLNHDIIKDLLTHKYFKHKSSLIRASCYQVITRLYQKSSILLLDNKQMINIIVDNLDENDPTVIPFIWETFLLIVEIVENWSTFINFDRQFLNRLWQILQKGGHGCANIIYPNFLMLLTKLPPLKELSFYDRFFENMRQGLDQRSVKTSKSESATIVVTFIECLRYVILTHESNLNFCEKLIKRHLFAFLQHNFTVNCSYNKIAIQETAFLIQYWYRNQNEHKNYKEYLINFQKIVEKLFEISLTELETCNLDGIKQITEKHKLFVTTFKNPYENFNKSSNHVKFATEECNNENLDIINMDMIENPEFDQNLTNLIYFILKSYFKIIDDRQLTILIDDSVELIRIFDQNNFLQNFNNYLNDTTTDGNLDKLYDYTIKWLRTFNEINRSLIDFVFILYNYSNSNEKSTILQELLNCKGDPLAWCIINGISTQFSNDLLIRNWLLSDTIGCYLLEIVDQSINSEWHPHLETILDSVCSNNELLVDPGIFSKIITKLQTILNNFDNYETITIKSVANLTSFLMDRIKNNQTLSDTRQHLSLTLFSFMCSSKITEILDGNTQISIKRSFLDYLKTYQTNENYVQQISNILQTKFLNYHQPIDYFTTIINDLLECVQYDSSIWCNLFKFDSTTIWREQLLKIGEYCKFLKEPNHQLTFNNFDREIDFNNFVQYFSWSTLKLSIIYQIYKNDEIHQIDTLLNWAEIVLDFIILEILIQNYLVIKDYDLLKQNYDLMHDQMVMFKQLTIDDDFTNALLDEISKFTQFWSKLLIKYCSNIINVDRNKLKSIDSSRVFIETSQEDRMFEKIEKIRERDTAKFLLEKNVCREEFQEILEILEFFSKFIKTFELEDFPMKRRHWDLVVISLASWSTNCLKLQRNYYDIDLQAFIIGLSQLLLDVIEKMEFIVKENRQETFDIIDEWENLFYVNVHNDFVKLWLKLTEYFDQSSLDLSIYSPFMQEFGKIIKCFNYKLIFGNVNDNLSNWRSVLKRSFNLLTNPLIILQLYGYQMLSVLVDGFIEIDLNTFDTNTFSNSLCLDYFKDCLLKVDGIVNELLQGFRLCDDCCQVEPHTDSYTYMFAYLNLWHIFLQLCEKSTSELRYQYADWYRKNDILKHFFDNLFKLMPSDIFTYNYNSNNNNNNNSNNNTTDSNENKLKLWRELFEKSPNLSFNQFVCYKSDKLEHYACWLYTLALSQLPALVRQWWSETESKSSQIIERITTFYVSPRLCHYELTDVVNHQTKFKNMTIKVLPQVREVVAIYTIDEAQMELVIALPANYPLKGPDVQCNRQIGGTSHKQWLIQLKKCLLHQNGRIWDGLSLWNNNLDKKFDGIEECYICFAVLHPGTYQLPKLSCRTCKKKFHSACLYKWFSTSNKSTCPICRNLF